MVDFQVLDAPELSIRSAKDHDAWALLELHWPSESDYTPIDHLRPRWPGYVHKLRGLRIETITERYGGPFAGHHARHIPRSRIRILEDGASKAAA